ncbi:MAG: aminotransferase class V-fold PLP-dependent enzyme [bacterium]|nr:aminotransferase class V-fold PLP-dependent enzyme [bacterium]MDE0289809.1 aminotransferase class V-fold PLP-dependent enzyme [bacterium]MDE0439967.1 aminotransferase class V-fold PLP-dependent enzyme [bacterium]
MDLTERFRPLFPITETRAYLFAGGLAPAAIPVKAALDQWADRWMFDPAYHRARYFDEWRVLKGRLAAVLGADPDEIAIVDNTSRGSNLAVQMIEPPPGANIVTDPTSHPSAVWPWLLPNRGKVEVRAVSAGPTSTWTTGIENLVDEHTIAVLVSHVDPRTGFRHDLSKLAELTRDCGGYLIVDAAQSAGAVSIDAGGEGIDFMSGTLMKWLLGPPGLGFLYARRGHVESLPPPHVGYVGSYWNEGSAGGSLAFHSGAARHEIGLADLPGIAAARRGLDIILEAGIPAVERHVVDLTGRIIEGLAERGIEVLTPAARVDRAGVVAFHFAGAVPLCRYLRKLGVDVWGYPEDDRVRADPHLYNTSDDVERLLAGIDAYKCSRFGGEP